MRGYALAVRTVATAATQFKPAAVLWNPSGGTKRLWVTKLKWIKITATADNLIVARASARGTQTTTLATATANDFDNDGAASTGATIDTVWSADPTVSTGNPLDRSSYGAAIGAGEVFTFPEGGIEIAPNTGLAIVTATALVLQAAECVFYWRE